MTDAILENTDDPEPTTSPALGPEPVPDRVAGVLPAAARPSRRLRAVAGTRRLVAWAFAIALFGGGVALGYRIFVVSQPPPIVAVAQATDGVDAPLVVKEFIVALASNDAAALRSAVSQDPYQLLIAEMARWNFQTLTRVQTLSTYADGPRAATELVMSGISTAGVPVTVNLVVHVASGRIVSFR